MNDFDNDFDEFFNHYIICALWSSTDTNLEGENINLDNEYSINDIDKDALKQLREEAEKFYNENKHLFKYEEHFKGDGYYSDAMLAGHDFWLSSHGHGAGFFDRNDLEHRGLLQERARACKEINLYIGENNLLYIY